MIRPLVDFPLTNRLPLETYLDVEHNEDFVGQVGNLRPIGNRPTASIFRIHGETPVSFAACRYAEQHMWMARDRDVLPDLEPGFDG
jgi:hypothetical protein